MVTRSPLKESSSTCSPSGMVKLGRFGAVLSMIPPSRAWRDCMVSHHLHLKFGRAQSLWRGLGWSGRKTFSCVHKIPIDSLRVFSNSPAIVYLFGARRLSQHNLISFLSRAPKRCLPRIYEGIPQVDYFLALSCSRRACGDEFPMNSTKQLHGFPPSAWKELS